ncbi:MAG TPA: tetratricopeptide repeat protein [Kiritimatiellia bacterium]
MRELKDGNNVRAKALFEQSVNKRPGSDANARAFNYIGIASWRLGQVQEAIDAFEDSRRVTPALVEPIYNEGYVLAESGNAVRAAELLTEAARMDPTDPRPLEVLGRFHTSRAQWPEARRALYGALERTPNSARVLTAIALVELGAGEQDKAEQMLMKALEKDDAYAPAYFNLAVFHERYEVDPRKAATYFERYLGKGRRGPRAEYAERALKRLRGEPEVAPAPVAPVKVEPPKTVAQPKPVPPPVTKPKPPQTHEELLKAASVEADQGRTETALELCMRAASNAAAAGRADQQEKALRIAAKICFDQPRAHAALGDFLLEAGQTDAALKAYKQATVLDGSFSPAQLGMVKAAMKAGEYDTALVGLKQAVKNDPKNADALWMLAEMYDTALSRAELAVKAYREFAQKFPRDDRAARAKSRADELEPKRSAVPESAVIVEAPGDDKPPVVENVKALAERPGSSIKYKKPVARNTRAAVQAFNQGTKYQEKREWDRAIYYYLRSLENDDMLASTFYNLAVAYSMKGERGGAKDAYLRALELQPDMVNARYNLALLYRDAADYASSSRLLEDVIRADPNHAPSYYVLGLIYAGSPATYELAKARYGKFLELAPNDPAARSARLWLETH